jgi:hypothetical protein
MSTYPGENPSGEPRDGGTEPTQPVGYWEQQAAEQARAQQSAQQSAQQGAQPTPPVYGGSAYGGPPAATPPPLYDAPTGYGYGAPPPYVGGYSAPGPDHPQSTLAMVLGIVGLLGGFTCGLPLLVSPFAWFLGRKALTEIRASQGRTGGESQAMAGMVMGIVGTVLLVLGILAIIGLIVLAVASDPSTTGTSTV